jgi:outer membrane usher protein
VDETLFVGFEINGRAKDTAAVIHRYGDDYLIRDADLAALRLNIPNGGAVEIDGAVYRPLSLLQPMAVSLDEARQILVLSLPQSAIQATSVDFGRGRLAPPTSRDWSLFLNYDATIATTDSYAIGTGALEGVVSGPYGSLTNSGLGQMRLDGGIGSSAASDGARSTDRAVRLESTYTYDNPDNLTRLRAGDSVSGYSSFAQQVRFGGIQFSTDFNLRPGQYKFGAPGLTGYLDNDASVALYVDNILRYTGNLPAGPFSFNDLPVTTGSGETRLVVRDLLGREQVITSSYYVSGDALAAGTQEFSYELGALREDYGTASFDYGDAFLSGTHRLGLTDWLTAEAHGEWQADRFQVGGGGVVIVPRIGQLSGTYAISHSDRFGDGWLWNVGFQRLGSIGSVSGVWERTSETFTQLDSSQLEPDDRRLIGRAQANVGINLGTLGSLSVGYGRLRFSDGSLPAVSTATYAVRLTDRTTISLIAAESQANDIGNSDDQRSVALLWTTVLGSRRSATAQVGHDDTGTYGSLDLRQQREGYYGFDYDLRGDFGGGDLLDRGIGRVDWTTPHGAFDATASVDGDQYGLQLAASGGVVAAGGGVFATEQVYDSVSVVTVPGYEGVTVFRDNQPVGKTDADGRLLIPNVRAYEENNVRLEPRDLPIDATVDSDRVLIVPRSRGAVVARFPVKRQSSAIVIVKRADGTWPPAGAEVTFEGGVDASFTGYDGEVFVSDLSHEVTGSIAFGGEQCRFTAPAKPVDSEPLPKLGPVTCLEGAP